MTPEQELTDMIEAEMIRLTRNHCNQGWGSDLWYQMCDDHDAMIDMPEPDRQNAALRKLYWLATDPDDMVH